MKQMTRLTVLCCLSFLITESFTQAQPPRRQGPGQRGQGQERRAPQNDFGAQQTPLLQRTLDTDGDGILSRAEIASSMKVLLKLDRNQDGTISSNELQQRGMRGERGQGPNSARQSGGPGQRGPGQRGPGQGNQQPGGTRGGGTRGGGTRGGGTRGGGTRGGGTRGGGTRGGGDRGQRDPGRADAAFAEQVRSLDENKDGKLVADELPEHMHKAFQLADSDKNGSLNQAELLVLAREFRRDKLPPADQVSEVKNRPVGPNGRAGNQP